MPIWTEGYGDLEMLPEEFKHHAFKRYKLEKHNFDSLQQIKDFLKQGEYTPKLASSHLGFLSKLIQKLTDIYRVESEEMGGIHNWHVQNTLRVAKRLHGELEEIRNQAF